MAKKTACCAGSRPFLKANPPISKVDPLSKIAVTFEPNMQSTIMQSTISYLLLCNILSTIYYYAIYYLLSTIMQSTIYYLLLCNLLLSSRKHVRDGKLS